jgi:hypothetical protein
MYIQASNGQYKYFSCPISNKDAYTIMIATFRTKALQEILCFRIIGFLYLCQFIDVNSLCSSIAKGNSSFFLN